MEKMRFEFIESYIKGVNDSADYQYHDNHGELIRCGKCKNYTDEGKCLLMNFYREADWYCASAIKRKWEEK